MYDGRRRRLAVGCRSLLGLDPLYEQITMGVILIGALALGSWTRKH